MIETTEKNSANHHAFIVLTNNISTTLLAFYQKISFATKDWGTTFIVYHDTNHGPLFQPHEYPIYSFTDSVLVELGYSPICDSLVPGNNHFPILKFFLDNPSYDYYWCIEDDVFFNGEWKYFFSKVIDNIQYDLISSYVRSYTYPTSNPNWPWWTSITKNGSKALNEADLMVSFNPIYSLSNRAIRFLDKALKSGWKGHHEVLIPTLLKNNKFILKDFGGDGPFIEDGFNDMFYKNETHLWRPVFEEPGKLLNKIYHPVKTNFKINSQFKISICLPVIQLTQIESTLKKSMIEIAEYENFDIVIIDGSSSGEIQNWLKNNFNSAIESKHISHYKIINFQELTIERIIKVAFKVATGDIICFLTCVELISKHLVDYLNIKFKTLNNIFITGMAPNCQDFSAHDKSESFCIRRDTLLILDGFNETSLKNESTLDQLRNSHLNELSYIEDKLKTTLHGYELLDKILVHWINPSTSIIIYIYIDGEFEYGTIVNTESRKLIESHSKSISNENPKQFTLEDSLISGKWCLSNDYTELMFQKNDASNFSLTVKEEYYSGLIDGKTTEFYTVNGIKEKKTLINVHFNRNNNFKSEAEKKPKSLEKTVLFKNFIENFPIIID